MQPGGHRLDLYFCRICQTGGRSKVRTQPAFCLIERYGRECAHLGGSGLKLGRLP